ncbi:MAG: helix-turn-helix transcriptional regulator [Planctomycetota bacterium]
MWYSFYVFIRNGTGYSQKEVVDHLGMHYSTISRLISKESEISRNKTLAILS